MAHTLITMLRVLVNFGTSVLEDDECERLLVVLHNMKFKVEKSRYGRLTADNVKTILKKSREMGLHSLAIAQSLQFEGGFSQKDVIGEWVPVGEPGVTDITSDEFGKWIHGLRWNEIDGDMVVRRDGLKRPVDLRNLPLVMKELQARFCKPGETLKRSHLPLSGAVIIYEKTGRPYLTHQFRRVWRDIATAAGISENVKNMTGRKGANDPDAVHVNRASS
jgi:hypothetical protein